MDTSTVTTTVCALLDTANVGEWRPSGPAYSAGEVGIFYGPILAAPDRAMGVTTYLQTDDPETCLAVRMVQVRYRGAKGIPNGADILADAGFAALHMLHHTSGIARITRSSTAPFGADGNGRQERVDNYRVIIDNPPEELS
ncbi:MAG: phage tail terminator protein [Rhodoglobus sp.]